MNDSTYTKPNDMLEGPKRIFNNTQKTRNWKPEKDLQVHRVQHRESANQKIEQTLTGKGKMTFKF